MLNKITEVQDHIASQAAFATQLRDTAAALASRPVDGPCDDTCGCSPSLVAARTPGAAGGCGPSCGCGASTDGTEAATVTLVTPPHDDVSPPIACSLGAGGMEARVTEWKAVLAHVVDRAPIPNGLRLTFGENPPLGAICRLAAAEVDCCSFFTMSLGFDRRGVTLEVTAPGDAQPLLESLFAEAA